MKVTLVKVIREVDNNNCKTEFGRFAKTADLLYAPVLMSNIRLGVNDSFFVDRIDQNLMARAIELYDFVDLHHYSSLEKYKKIKKNLLKNKWIILP
jgi:hypothetical protein